MYLDHIYICIDIYTLVLYNIDLNGVGMYAEYARKPEKTESGQ